MSGGEVFAVIFVALVFVFGIVGGIKLFKANQRQRAEMEQSNAEKRARKASAESQ